MAGYQPRRILGKWREGFALDVHTISSIPIGHDASAASGRKILLFDDLYRSGATMNSITTLLYDQGNASDVFALTITRTRSNR